jgi:hypothetical protein
MLSVVWEAWQNPRLHHLNQHSSAFTHAGRAFNHLNQLANHWIQDVRHLRQATLIAAISGHNSPVGFPLEKRGS